MKIICGVVHARMRAAPNTERERIYRKPPIIRMKRAARRSAFHASRENLRHDDSGVTDHVIAVAIHVG